MLLGYNTNGFPHHALRDAIDVLAGLGYRSVAITLDHAALNPFDANLAQQVQYAARQLNDLGLASVVETGARFLLDPRRKHEPTLMTADPIRRAKRVDFYRRAIDVAAQLGSGCVSLWSGILHDACPQGEAWERLVEGLQLTLTHAEASGVKIGFEPEPGMFVDNMAAFDDLLARIPDRAALQLTLDIGHLHCQRETPIADYIRRYASRLVNVHIEDMRASVHEHLQFGDGEMEFPPILKALEECCYTGPVHVELSRHGHQAPAAARHARDFLAPLMPAAAIRPVA